MSLNITLNICEKQQLLMLQVRYDSKHIIWKIYVRQWDIIALVLKIKIIYYVWLKSSALEKETLLSYKGWVGAVRNAFFPQRNKIFSLLHPQGISAPHFTIMKSSPAHSVSVKTRLAPNGQTREWPYGKLAAEGHECRVCSLWQLG